MRKLDPRYGLGLEQDVNRLTDYNPLWPRAFTEEAAAIKAKLGDRVLAIEHYGSTSIPGLRAKPIIDLQIGVADIRDGFAFIPPFAALGYEYMGDQGIPDHHVFGRGAVRTHHAHVLVYQGDQWFRTLRFRDCLRAQPDLRAAYEALKLELAAGATTRADYTAGKTSFVEQICGS